MWVLGELNSGLLEDQSVLLTTEPSLQPKTSSIYGHLSILGGGQKTSLILGKKSDFMSVLGNSHTSEYFWTSETPAGFSPFSYCVPICHEHLHIDCIRLAEPQKFLKLDFCFRSI